MDSLPAKNPTPRSYWPLLAAITALHIVPLWLTAFNPLVDFPFHLARVYALHQYDQVPFFQQTLELALYPMPNLAIDLLLTPLMGWIDPVVAGKLFLSLSVLLMACGCHMLGVELHGRPTLGAPLSLFLLFNTLFLFGFANYIFAYSLFPFVLALWMRWRRRWSWGKWLAASTLVLLGYLSHLSCFAFLAVAIGVITLVDWWDQWAREHQFPARSILFQGAAGLAVVVPAILIHLYPWGPKQLQFGSFIWAGPFDKLSGLAGPLLSYHPAWIAGYAVALAVIGLAAWVMGEWKVNRSGMAAVGVLIFLFLICPKQLASSATYDADRRAIPPAYTLAALSLDVRLRKRWKAPLLAGLVAVGTVRCLEITCTWMVMSRDTVDAVQALEHVEPNSRIYPIILLPENRMDARRYVSNNGAVFYALIYRHAISIMLWTPGASPIYFRNPEEWDAEHRPAALNASYLSRRLPAFQYVYGFRLDPSYEKFLQTQADLTSRRGLSSVWRVRP